MCPFETLAIVLLLGFSLALDLKVALVFPLLMVFLSSIETLPAYSDVAFLHRAVLAKRPSASMLIQVNTVAQACGQLTATVTPYQVMLLRHRPSYRSAAIRW